MSVALMMSIGIGVRRARLNHNLTQEKVAERVGLSAQFYGRIERGKALPSVVSLSRLTNELDVSADELLGRRQQHPEVNMLDDVDAEHAADEEAYLTLDRLPVRRVMRKLRQASPGTLRLVAMLLNELSRDSRRP